MRGFFSRSGWWMRWWHDAPFWQIFPSLMGERICGKVPVTLSSWTIRCTEHPVPQYGHIVGTRRIIKILRASASDKDILLPCSHCLDDLWWMISYKRTCLRKQKPMMRPVQIEHVNTCKNDNFTRLKICPAVLIWAITDNTGTQDFLNPNWPKIKQPLLILFYFWADKTWEMPMNPWMVRFFFNSRYSRVNFLWFK